MCAARSDERRVTSDEWEVGSMKKAQCTIEGRNAAGSRIPQEECAMQNAQCTMGGRNAAGRRIPQEEGTMRNAQCRMHNAQSTMGGGSPASRQLVTRHLSLVTPAKRAGGWRAAVVGAVAVLCLAGGGTRAWGAENDTHVFAGGKPPTENGTGQIQSTQMNNNTAIPTITITSPSYSIKTVSLAVRCSETKGKVEVTVTVNGVQYGDSQTYTSTLICACSASTKS